MNDLQAIIDFQIELSKFINIDLFRRGLYQIRINHHISPKIPHKIEVNFLQDSSFASSKKKESLLTSPNIVFPSCIINGVAVSKTFNILYKNEEVNLNDVIRFKDHLIVDSSNCLKQLLSTEFYLDVELWFTESNYVPSNQDQIRLMFRRQLKLNFNVCQGLHYYLPVTFDYFHLSTITLSVHACLVTLCLPYLQNKLNKSNSDQLETSNHGLGYDHLFFGCSFNEIQNQINTNCTEILKLRQRRAQLLHWQLCSLLLTSIQNLSRKFNEFLKLLPPLIQCKFRKDRSLTNFQLTNLSKLAQKCHISCLKNGFKPDGNEFFQIQNINFAKEILKDDKQFKNNLIDKENESKLDNQINNEKLNSSVDKNDNKIDELSIYQPEDYIASIVSELAYICGCHITIWQSFIKLITHNEKINQHLSKIHHLHRCKRFSEAFFVKEKPLQQLISTDSNNGIFFELSDKLRRSKYLQLLPVCQIECVSLDGDHNTMPIIFEEKFDFDSDELITNNDKNIKSNNSIQNKKEILINKNLRRSSSDISTNSSLTSSSLNSATNTSSDSSGNTSGNIINDDKSHKSSFKLKDKIVLNLNKLNLNRNLITRRKSSISYLSKQEQQKIVLNENLSASSSTNNSNNSSLNSQITNKSLNVETQQNATVVDSPKIIINSVSNDESPKRILEQLNYISNLNSFKHYNNLKGDPEEFILDNNSSSIYSLVETISLNNIKFVNDQQQNTNDTNSKQKKKKSLASSESLPDLSVKKIQKSIKRMTKKNSKKLKSSKKDKKESNNSKHNKSLNLNESNNVLIDTISLNFPTNIDSLNKTNLDIEEKDEFSDLDGFIDENEDKNDNNASDKKTKDVQKCTILEMFTKNTCLVCGIENCNCIQDFEITIGSKNLSIITNELVQFVKAKEQFRKEMNLKTNGWSIYSDFSTPSASRIPYFQLCDNDLMRTFNSEGAHLVVCVHGLDGNSCDLRLIKTYLELLLPMTNFDFLMSESNQGKTYDSFEIMTDRLCDEIVKHIQSNLLEPTKVSFIGHSLGNIIIRSVLRKQELAFLLPKLHCFLSLSGPHLGTIYMTNNLVNIGLWVMQKWKKSNSILQLTLKDNVDPYKTFIYNLSKDSKIHLFKYVLLFGSSQDHYVPIHSAHIRDCNQSKSDYSVTGQVYRDMINNILKPFLNKKPTTSTNLVSENNGEIVNLDKQLDQKRCSKLIRYDVLHCDGGGTNSLIGRQAHIAVLDCELFIEKFVTISGLKYFS